MNTNTGIFPFLSPTYNSLERAKVCNTARVD